MMVGIRWITVSKNGPTFQVSEILWFTQNHGLLCIFWVHRFLRHALLGEVIMLRQSLAAAKMGRGKGMVVGFKVDRKHIENIQIYDSTGDKCRFFMGLLYLLWFNIWFIKGWSWDNTRILMDMPGWWWLPSGDLLHSHWKWWLKSWIFPSIAL